MSTSFIAPKTGQYLVRHTSSRCNLHLRLLSTASLVCPLSGWTVVNSSLRADALQVRLNFALAVKLKEIRMRTFTALAVAVASVAIAGVSLSVSSQPTPQTIEQCAAVLPKGENFTFTVSGSIDTTGPAPKLTGEMSLSDGTQRDRANEGRAFGECIARFFK